MVSRPGGTVDLARRVETAYGDAGELQRRPDPGGEVAGLLQSRRTTCEPTEPQPSTATFSGLSFTASAPTSVASRSSSVSRRTITRTSPSRTATTGGRSRWL